MHVQHPTTFGLITNLVLGVLGMTRKSGADYPTQRYGVKVFAAWSEIEGY